jgi:hypothetical protein
MEQAYEAKKRGFLKIARGPIWLKSDIVYLTSI